MGSKGEGKEDIRCDGNEMFKYVWCNQDGFFKDVERHGHIKVQIMVLPLKIDKKYSRELIKKS